MPDLLHATRIDELIVRSILDHVDPELILLGGSRAWGTPDEESDYDLMLVMRDAPSVEVANREARTALSEAGIRADVFALCAHDYCRDQHDPGLLPFRIAREGRVLYSTGNVSQRSPRPDGVREGLPREGLESWIRRARAHLLAAESILVSSCPSWDAVCFHAHASVEKLLKALIVRSGTFPPRTHDLAELLRMQPPVIRALSGLDAACTLLMRLLPKSRYPELPEPMPDEARAAMSAAQDAHVLLLPFCRSV